MTKRGKIGVLVLCGITAGLVSWSVFAQDEDERILPCSVPVELQRNFILKVNPYTRIAVGQSRADLEEVQRSIRERELAFHVTDFDKEVVIGDYEIEVDKVKSMWYPYRMSAEYAGQEYVLVPITWFKIRDDFYYVYRTLGACEVEWDD